MVIFSGESMNELIEGVAVTILKRLPPAELEGGIGSKNKIREIDVVFDGLSSRILRFRYQENIGLFGRLVFKRKLKARLFYFGYGSCFVYFALRRLLTTKWPRI